MEKEQLGLLFDLYNFASLVSAALRTGAVRHFLFVAVGTLRQRVPGERVMGATRGGALLGMSAFRIRHDDSFSVASCQYPVASQTRAS